MFLILAIALLVSNIFMILILKRVGREDYTIKQLKVLSWIFTITYAVRAVVMILKAVEMPSNIQGLDKY
jgi:uncharacterized protein (DUF486 family)